MGINMKNYKITFSFRLLDSYSRRYKFILQLKNAYINNIKVIVRKIFFASSVGNVPRDSFSERNVLRLKKDWKTLPSHNQFIKKC